MTPVEALLWVVVGVIALLAIVFIAFVVAGFVSAWRRQQYKRSDLDTCGVKGPDGVVCQRAPHVVGLHGARTPNGVERW